MCFRVSQAPSRYCGLVFAVCFQELLQQRLIHTYCTSSCRRAVYFWKQDSQSRRRTSNHWRACRSSTLYAVCTSNLSNRVVQWIQLLASSIVPTMRWYYNEIHFSICIQHLQLQLQHTTLALHVHTHTTGAHAHNIYTTQHTHIHNPISRHACLLTDLNTQIHTASLMKPMAHAVSGLLAILASFVPRPTPFSVAQRMRKAWYLF